MQKNKIAILQTPTCGLNLKIHGGMERIELCQLSGLLKRGYQARLYVSKLTDGRSPNITVIHDINYKNRYLQVAYYLLFMIKNWNHDIYHGFFTPWLSLLSPAKTITHFQGNAIFELPLYRYFKKRYNKSYYVFLSDYTKQQFIRQYPCIDLSRCFLIYNFVDTDFFKPRDPAIKTDPLITRICFYGGWIPVKGIFDILAAAEMLEKRRSDFRIFLGGSAFSHYKDTSWGNSTDIDRKVRDWTARLKTVEIVGDLEYHQLPEFINSMDFGLMPSTYPEPFGIVNIEIMACAKPVIATRVGGIPEIIDDGINGFLVNPNTPEELADKIACLLSDKDKVKKMGAAARQKVLSKFSMEHYLDEITTLYAHIMASKRRTFWRKNQ